MIHQNIAGNQYITTHYTILQSITTYYYGLTKKRTDNSLKNMNYYPMINLVQGVPVVHLENAKGRNQPKCNEKQMSTSIKSTAFKPMCIWPRPAALAIISHFNHWSLPGPAAATAVTDTLRLYQDQQQQQQLQTP